MQKRRRPLGERAGQLSNCPSELAQISELIRNLYLSIVILKIILLFKIIVHIIFEQKNRRRIHTMSNACVIRHQGYIKPIAQCPYRHNSRKSKSYSNENIDTSYTKFNSTIEDNLLEGETYLKAFYRHYNNGAFTGQLKEQGDENKQTKFLDEFLVYPPNESMALTEEKSLI